jgi:hypothetical protein
MSGLTDEQVAFWRNLLITLPLPPFGLSLGPYALIMPAEQIQAVRDRLVEIWLEEAKKRNIPKAPEPPKPTNIIRTRPRRKQIARPR